MSRAPSPVLMTRLLRELLSSLLDLGSAGATELAAAVGSDQSYVLKVLHTLQDVGYVHETPEPAWPVQDHRCRFFSLTQIGIDFTLAAEAEARSRANKAAAQQARLAIARFLSRPSNLEHTS